MNYLEDYNMRLSISNTDNKQYSNNNKFFGTSSHDQDTYGLLNR
jgi:hypothetical protein